MALRSLAPLLLGCWSLLTLTAEGSRALELLVRGCGRLADAGRHDEAVVKYRAALSSSTSGQMRHAEVATYNLGLSLADLGRHAEAAGAFDDALTALQAQPPARRHPERIAAAHVSAAESRARTAQVRKFKVH
jgi:hypothetical protein